MYYDLILDYNNYKHDIGEYGKTPKYIDNIKSIKLINFEKLPDISFLTDLKELNIFDSPNIDDNFPTKLIPDNISLIIINPYTKLSNISLEYINNHYETIFVEPYNVIHDNVIHDNLSANNILILDTKLSLIENFKNILLKLSEANCNPIDKLHKIKVLGKGNYGEAELVSIYEISDDSHSVSIYNKQPEIKYVIKKFFNVDIVTSCVDLYKKPAKVWISKGYPKYNLLGKKIDYKNAVLCIDDYIIEFLIGTYISYLYYSRKCINFLPLHTISQCNDEFLLAAPFGGKKLELLLQVLKPNQLECIIIQVIYALYILQSTFKINHNDLNTGNILLLKPSDIIWETYNISNYKYINYKIPLNSHKNINLYIPTKKLYIAKIIDYGFGASYNDDFKIYNKILIEPFYQEYMPDYFSKCHDLLMLLNMCFIDNNMFDDVSIALKYAISKLYKNIYLSPSYSTKFEDVNILDSTQLNNKLYKVILPNHNGYPCPKLYNNYNLEENSPLTFLQDYAYAQTLIQNDSDVFIKTHIDDECDSIEGAI